MMCMELFGFDLPSIYLTVLIGSGICVILTLLLSDLFGGDVGIFNPTLILAFLRYYQQVVILWRSILLSIASLFFPFQQ